MAGKQKAELVPSAGGKGKGRRRLRPFREKNRKSHNDRQLLDTGGGTPTREKGEGLIQAVGRKKGRGEQSCRCIAGSMQFINRKSVLRGKKPPTNARPPSPEREKKTTYFIKRRGERKGVRRLFWRESFTLFLIMKSALNFRRQKGGKRHFIGEKKENRIIYPSGGKESVDQCLIYCWITKFEKKGERRSSIASKEKGRPPPRLRKNHCYF